MRKITLINQQPNVPGAKVAHVTLPILLRVMDRLERITGYRWRITSFLRDSPSHRRGVSIDFSPDISESDLHKYGPFQNPPSDPVLYKRTKLVRALQRLCRDPVLNREYADIGIYIEPDHLHVQLFSPESNKKNRVRLMKWRLIKPVYTDSARRSKLPMLP